MYKLKLNSSTGLIELDKRSQEDLSYVFKHISIDKAVVYSEAYVIEMKELLRVACMNIDQLLKLINVGTKTKHTCSFLNNQKLKEYGVVE